MALLNSVMSFINSVSAITPDVVAPSKMWHVLILKAFSFVADYGWRIVVFTILLKLVLSPLDFFQRYKMHKNMRITERLRPTMEKIQKQYGNDKQAFAQKQMELNRKEGYSYFSSCLPMIATMVVFITLWLSMNTVAQYMTFKEYTTLYDEYNIVTEKVIDDKGDKALAKEIAQDAVFTLYYDGITDEYVDKLKADHGLSDGFTLENKDKLQASFLWIKNIWAPDVPWGSKAILSWESFEKAISDYKNTSRNGLTNEQVADCLNETTYGDVMGKLLNDETRSRTNGYLILPILVVLLSVSSQIISSLQQKRAGQVNNKGGMATSMKVMMFIMPAMMAVFAIQYASIFTLYMVMNSALSLIINFLFSAVIKLAENIKARRSYGIRTGSTRGAVGSSDSAIIHYVKGANPDAGKKPDPAALAEEKQRGKAKKADPTPTVKRSGRPDPNDLMNMDMSAGKKKK